MRILTKIVPFLLLAVYSVYLYFQVSNKVPIYVGHLFHNYLFTPWLILIGFFLLYFIVQVSYGKAKVLLVSILSIIALVGVAYLNKKVVIPNDILNYSLFASCAIGLLGTFYYIFYAKTGYVVANPRNFEVGEGVFYRNRNNTIMNDVKDHDMFQTFSDLLLGIGTIRIQIKGNKSDNFTIENLSKKDAEILMNYLKTHAHGSYTEYRESRDRARDIMQNKGPQPKRRDSHGGMIDDDAIDGDS